MANSDETTTIPEHDDMAWVADQRKSVELYLQNQRCDHAGVSLEPRWFLSPYLAIWAVRSKANPGLVGWWAISGDVPTDYMTASSKLRSIGDVMTAFGKQWSASAAAMSQGQYMGFGSLKETARIAPLLQSRAALLIDFAEQLKNEESEV